MSHGVCRLDDDEHSLQHTEGIAAAEAQPASEDDDDDDDFDWTNPDIPWKGA